jgi:carbon monoxide dehydrogenase subunit G
MQFANTVVVGAPRERVWAFLLDVHTLSQCVPGLQRMEVLEAGRAFGGIASLDLGPSTVNFPARVEWVEQEALRRGRLRALARFSQYLVEGEGTLELADDPGGTRLSWHIGVVLPQELGDNQMMRRLVRTFTARFLKEFFECVLHGLEAV